MSPIFFIFYIILHENIHKSDHYSKKINKKILRGVKGTANGKYCRFLLILGDLRGFLGATTPVNHFIFFRYFYGIKLVHINLLVQSLCNYIKNSALRIFFKIYPLLLIITERRKKKSIFHPIFFFYIFMIFC